MATHRRLQPHFTSFRYRLQLLGRYLHRAVDIIKIVLLTLGPGRVIKCHFQRKVQRGEAIVLQSNYAPPASVSAEQRANITPKTDFPSRKSKVMKWDTYPTTDYAFVFHNKPLSGNIINGLGETTKRRPTRIFFYTGKDSQGWDTLEQYMYTAVVSFNVLRSIFYMQWIGIQNNSPVAPVTQPITDPHEMSVQIKTTAGALGAVLVGITELKSEHIYEDIELSYRYAISCVIPMDREQMLHTPSETSARAIFDAYSTATKLSIELAKHIRGLGWEARASSNEVDKPEIVHPPVAVAAGLGQLGKHGSLITKEYGSNVRLATVLTNLPMVMDKPIDIGVDDFCVSCQICTTNCPPQAIFDTKQMVRGQEKWCVDFDTCVPYFVSYHGCGICIEVCPWSEEGRGATISQKMLERRQQPSG